MAYATKTNILTFASKAWGTTFAGSSLDAAIGACLGDLNGSDLLQGHVGWDGSVLLTTGHDKVLLPADYKSITAIQLADIGSKNRVVVLQEVPGGVTAFRSWQIFDSTVGQPQWYVEEPTFGHLRVYPKANQNYEIRLDYWANHPLTPDAIVYPAHFQHLLNLGTVYWEAVLRRNQEYIEHWGPLYYAERRVAENQVVPIERSINP